MKFYPNIILLFVAAAILVGCRNDPWEEIRPYFGEKQEESLQIYHVPLPYDNDSSYYLPVFLLKSSTDWAHKEIARIPCSVEPMPSEQDERVMGYLNKQDEPCTIWRSKGLYGLPDTRYQAVAPTYILLQNGEVIFYLHDEYTMWDRIAPRVDSLPKLSREK